MKTIKHNGMDGSLVKWPKPLWNYNHENLKILWVFFIKILHFMKGN